MRLLAGVHAVQIEAQHDPMPTHSGLLGITIFFFGVALTAYGVITRARQRRWRATARAACGRVVDNVVERRPSGRRFWVPLVEFEVGSRRQRFAASAAGARQRWPLGSAFDVLYDPAHPDRAGAAATSRQLPLSLLFGLVTIGGYLALVV